MTNLLSIFVATCLALQVECGPQLVVFGGMTTDGKAYPASIKVNAYDTATGTKTPLKDLPMKAGAVAAQNFGITVGARAGKLFVGGGTKNAGKAWTIANKVKADATGAMDVTTRQYPVIQWIDDTRVLVFGAQPSYEVYNTASKKWNEKSNNMYVSTEYMLSPSAAVYKDEIYIVTGSNKNFVKFIKATEKLEKLPPTPTAVKDQAVAVLGDQLIMCGGEEGGKQTAACKAYTFSTKKWSDFASLTTARARLGLTVVGGKLYAVGGWAMAGGKVTFYNTVEVYDGKAWASTKITLANGIINPTVMGVDSLTKFWY